MINKEMIKKLKDNAELAWASYGYFHLADENYKPEGWWNKDKKRLEEFRKIKNKELKQNNIQIAEVELQNIYPTPTDILNIDCKYYKNDKGNDKNSLLDDTFLGGDFSPTQAKNFFKHYELIEHCPNTDSGFSATLFQDKESKDFILAFRGTK